MLENVVVIEKDKLLEEVNKVKISNYRFAAMTCEAVEDKYEFIYHFDLNYELKNLRFTAEKNEEIESISSVYPSAFLIENEVQDLFGFKFNNLIIDYRGSLYMVPDGPKAPQMKEGGI